MQKNAVVNDDVNALPFLLPLLNSRKKGFQKEACWTLSNITAGSQSQIQAVIDAKLIPPLVNLLCNADFDIKKEAACAIANALRGGSSEQIGHLVATQHGGCVRPLCNLLAAGDNRIVTAVLDALESILNAGRQTTVGSNRYAECIINAGGVDKIKQLLERIHHLHVHHQNNVVVGVADISKKAMHILETYFFFFFFEKEEDTSAFSFGALSAAMPMQQEQFNF